MLVNFIALMMPYRIYGMLNKMNLLGHFSTENAFRHLDRIYMLRIGDQWKLLEIYMKSRIQIEKRQIPIMQKNGNCP